MRKLHEYVNLTIPRLLEQVELWFIAIQLKFEKKLNLNTTQIFYYRRSGVHLSCHWLFRGLKGVHAFSLNQDTRNESNDSWIALLKCTILAPKSRINIEKSCLVVEPRLQFIAPVHRTSSSNNKRTRSKAFTLRSIGIKTNAMHHQETLNKQRPDTYHVLDRGPIDLLCFLLIDMLCLLVTNINLNVLKTNINGIMIHVFGTLIVCLSLSLSI